MKLAIITCDKLPNGVKDDQSFFQSLRNMGIELDIVPWNSQIDWSTYHACLMRSVWDYHENIVAFNQWLNDVSRQTTLINNKEMVLWNQNKIYLAELEKVGIEIAPTIWLKQNHQFDMSQWCAHQSASVFFLKPVVGADSSGTLRFANTAKGITLAERHLTQWLPQINMMLQPYLSSVEKFGETSAIYFSGQFSHAVRKVPVNGDYRVQDTFGANDLPYTMSPSEMSLSKACLKYLQNRFGEVLYARFDFLHDDEGLVYLNEAELIEPSLFFNHGAMSANTFAQAVANYLSKID
jgi:hypothetical protein